MKRLIFSDLHLHPWAYGASIEENGFNSRLWAQWLACQEMIEEAEECGIKYAYFCGDLFHQHGQVPTQALSIAGALFARLRERGIKIRAIPGNHDQFNQQGSIHALSWLPTEETCGTWEDDGLTVRALPYTSDEEIIKRFLGTLGQGSKMVLLHQGVSGVPISSGYVLDERLTPAMIPDDVRAFTGHYHFHRAVTPNLTVVGNLTPLNWNDADQEKGWVIWDDETGYLEQHIQTKHPHFLSFDYERELSTVESNFIRYITPVEPLEQESIRKDLESAGALTVEFPSVKINAVADNVRSGEVVTAEHLVKVFEEREMSERRREVGVEIRSNNYNGG